jgi:hypothetical protein
MTNLKAGLSLVDHETEKVKHGVQGGGANLSLLRNVFGEQLKTLPIP